MCFAKEIIVPTTPNPTRNTSARQRQLQLIFPGAIGALDGTLVSAVIPVDQQTRYRGRGKGGCFQNVIGICDFDMIFTFLWAGWEGVSHDSRVLKEVAFNPTSGFPFPPPGKYYLCLLSIFYLYSSYIVYYLYSFYIINVTHLQINITFVTRHIPTLAGSWRRIAVLGIG